MKTLFERMSDIARGETRLARGPLPASRELDRRPISAERELPTRDLERR